MEKPQRYVVILTGVAYLRQRQASRFTLSSALLHELGRLDQGSVPLHVLAGRFGALSFSEFAKARLIKTTAWTASSSKCQSKKETKA
jgi:hypothetical protein